jgi:anti-anti-sigma factor
VDHISYVAPKAHPTAARAVVVGVERYALVEVRGEIDILSRHELGEALCSAGGTGVPAVIVDLSAVTLLSAGGFHCLQQAADPLAERNGRLHVVCPPGSLTARILRLFDPDGRWPVHADLAAAIAAVA